VDELLDEWRDPVFDDPHWHVPTSLAARLTEMAAELTAGVNVSEAIEAARTPGARADRPVKQLRIGSLPTGMRMFYDRMGSLLVLASIARSVDAATFAAEDPPSDAQQHFGSVIGQAFHEGCSLADVALATGLSEEEVVVIGKRTIKRRKWLQRL
jgi:hypothetical protein